MGFSYDTWGTSWTKSGRDTWGGSWGRSVTAGRTPQPGLPSASNTFTPVFLAIGGQQHLDRIHGRKKPKPLPPAIDRFAIAAATRTQRRKIAMLLLLED